MDVKQLVTHVYGLRGQIEIEVSKHEIWIQSFVAYPMNY